MKDAKNLTKTDGRLIKTIRVGIHLSPVLKTRVVLDLWPDQDYEVLHFRLFFHLPKLIFPQRIIGDT